MKIILREIKLTRQCCQICICSVDAGLSEDRDVNTYEIFDLVRSDASRKGANNESRQQEFIMRRIEK